MTPVLRSRRAFLTALATTAAFALAALAGPPQEHGASWGEARAASIGGMSSDPPVILVLGDSISAGYGLPPGTGWTHLLQQRLVERGYVHRVVNASISGDTTAGGRSRLPALLGRHKPAIVVIELGGNDGLRGGSLAATRDRPLFTQGRRPPALATAQPASENPQTAILSPPPFALIGTVVGDGEKIALVMENATQKVLRLPVGEIASGWSVADVASRSVTLKRGAEVVTLELPKPLLR